MKKYIIVVSFLILGIFIYGLIAGPGDSIKSALKNVWENEIQWQSDIYP